MSHHGYFSKHERARRFGFTEKGMNLREVAIISLMGVAAILSAWFI